MKNKSALIILSLVLLYGLIHWRFFFTGSILTWGDWGWYFPETVREWFTYPQLWVVNASGGIDISLTQYIPARLLYGFLSHFLEFRYFDRIVFILPSVIVPVVSIYLLTSKITNSRMAGIISTFVYSLNSYMLVIQGGHFPLAVSFGLAPLILLLYIKSLETKNTKMSLLCGLICSLSFAYEPRGLVLTSAVVFSYYLYYLFIIQKSNIFRQALSTIKYLLTPFIVVICVSLYSLVGLKYASSEIGNNILSRTLFGGGYVNIQRAFTVSNNAWTQNIQIDRNFLYIIPYFWLVPFLAFIGLWFGKRKPLVVFFGLISLIGIFFAKQTNAPFVDVYEWLFRYFPGFKIFREPSKFYILIALGYSILVGNLYVEISNILKINKKGKAILVLFLILPFVLNAIPIVSNSIGKMSSPRNIPNDYLIFRNFILNNYGDFRILWVPMDSKWAYWDSSVRRMSAYYYSIGDWKNFSNYDKEGLEYSASDHIMSFLEKEISKNLLDQYSVRYVGIPVDDIKNDESYSESYGRRSVYLNRINNLKFLKPLNIGTSELVLFENPSYQPIINWTINKESTKERQDIFPVEYTRSSSSQYDLVIRNIPSDIKVIHLNFAEKYDPGWKISAFEQHWISSLFLKEYYLNPLSHSPSDLNINIFSLNPNQIGSLYPDTRSTNENGSFNLKLHLYFSPQAYVNFASVVSLVSLLFIGILFLLPIRRHE